MDSLVGPAKWQAIILGDKQTLLTSGDDLVSCFYLFKVPRQWSRYFAFRKQVSRAALGLEGPPGSMAYVASAVLPMGWAAAVTIMQHIHRSIAYCRRTDFLKKGRFTEAEPCLKLLLREQVTCGTFTLMISVHWKFFRRIPCNTSGMM